MNDVFVGGSAILSEWLGFYPHGPPASRAFLWVEEDVDFYGGLLHNKAHQAKPAMLSRASYELLNDSYY